MLSFPNETDANVIFLKEGSSGNVIFESQIKEQILHPQMNKSDVVPPYNAYSPPGDVQVGKSPADYTFLYL